LKWQKKQTCYSNNWILFGFKGAGKTHFGKLMGAPFVDTDDLIEKKKALSIRQLVQQKGEPYFRHVEREVIAHLNVQKHIIAVGSGAVLHKQNLKNLQLLGKMIYLKCPKAILKKRMLCAPIPTYLDAQDPEGSFEKMYCTRISIYERIPSYILNLEGKTESEILEKLWQVINSATSSGSPPGENPTAKPLEL